MIIQNGKGNIALQNISGSTVNITQITAKSAEYQQLKNRLQELDSYFKRIPKNETSERLQYSQKINEQKQTIQSFEDDVRSLAATFEHIESNTERLKIAKSHFKAGEFTKAHAVLEAESSAMASDQERLLFAREQKSQELVGIEQQLKNNATEYLIYAQTLELDYTNSERFELAKGAFQKSISSFGFSENIFAYALFLQYHNQFSAAEALYQRLIAELKESLSFPERAATLNNLAILHNASNELSQAEEEYVAALKIYRDLAEDNPRVYLPNVAAILNNLGLLGSDTNNLTRAEEEYVEALKIRRERAEDNPLSMRYVADTLNNLATLHNNKNKLSQAEEEYTEALKIYRELAEDNPPPYLPYVAMTLNNLAILHTTINELSRAEEEYVAALKIYYDLAEDNPCAYLPDMAGTLNNLAILHTTINELSRAEEEYVAALKIYYDLAEECGHENLKPVYLISINKK